jgi:hypothetical protein
MPCPQMSHQDAFCISLRSVSTHFVPSEQLSGPLSGPLNLKVLLWHQLVEAGTVTLIEWRLDGAPRGGSPEPSG